TGGAFFAVKIWWLLGLAGCDRVAFVRMVLKEVIYVLLIYVPMVAVLAIVDSLLFQSAIGLIWMTAAHLFNWKIRRAYVIE
ncbi:MAG: hypothetical protein ABW171_11590, partial [Steroidobacter sp.]